MFVYVNNRQDGTVHIVTMDRCEAEPWRWEYVGITPGQDESIEALRIKEMSKDVEEVVEPKKRVSKK